MVSGNKHEGYEGHTFGFPGFQLCQHGVKGWITFDGAHMEIGQSACFQHIVHLTVDGGTGGIGAVAHKDEVFFGSFLALCRGVVAVPQNTCHFLCIFDRVEQGSTYTYFLEEG